MSLHYADDWLTVLHGDVRDELRALPDESVHCVVTSPPYWGLRDYGTATWEGGDPACDHKSARIAIGNSPSAKSTLTTNNGKGPKPGDKFSEGSQFGYAARCPCGAVRLDNQIGLEPTPEQYVENMVAVFREVRRVLRSDGTLWLNLGDSYGATTKHGGLSGSTGLRPYATKFGKAIEEDAKGTRRVQPGVKPKDLVGIPWRVAFALQADGWYLRSDIIWSKPNPMPESVTDRPTKSHEYLFLLAKSARYYFDSEAVRRPISPYNLGRVSVAPHGSHVLENGHRAQEVREYDEIKGANIRSVWTIATAPYPGAHFATFPPKLVEPCIKAGTSEKGVCPECGAPWERVVERPDPTLEDRRGPKHRDKEDDLLRRSSFHVAGWRKAEPDIPTTTGWRPSCAHNAQPVTATVLDPFAGSGTTGMVAQSLSRRAVLIDLNVDYLGQLMDRNRDIPLGLETA